MTDTITAGFIPLVDATSLVLAADLGFAEHEGLELKLVREVSWANMREKLNAGVFDVAHLLAPMAVASSLELMPGSVPLSAPLVLAINGNAVTVSLKLMNEIKAELAGTSPDLLATAKALGTIIKKRKRAGEPPLTFSSTFPFSGHSYFLHFWLATAGIHASKDLRLIVLPPSYMVESLKSGEVDGFCVGEPWNSVAVDQGDGHILHFTCECMGRLPEKVLAMRADWLAQNEEITTRLIRAVAAASTFARQPENWDLCCEKLSYSNRIAVQPDQIRRALSCKLKISPQGEHCFHPQFLILGQGLYGQPQPQAASRFYQRMVEWGQIQPDIAGMERALSAFSPDLFDRVFPNASYDKPHLDWPNVEELPKTL